MSSHGDPPNAASLIAATPQVGGSTHEIGRTQSGQQRQRHEEPADQPDRELQRGAERPGRPVADRARPRAGSPSGRSPIAVTTRGERRRRADASSEIGMPKANRPHSRVATRLYSADRGHRQRHRARAAAGTASGAATSSSRVPCRRSCCSEIAAVVATADHTPMMLAPTAAVMQRRPRCRACAVHEQHRGGEEQRVDDAEHAVEGRPAAHLQLEPPADRRAAAASRLTRCRTACPTSST